MVSFQANWKDGICHIQSVLGWMEVERSHPFWVRVCVWASGRCGSMWKGGWGQPGCGWVGRVCGRGWGGLGAQQEAACPHGGHTVRVPRRAAGLDRTCPGAQLCPGRTTPGHSTEAESRGWRRAQCREGSQALGRAGLQGEERLGRSGHSRPLPTPGGWRGHYRQAANRVGPGPQGRGQHPGTWASTT